ncbi:MAG: LacI family DNA-binding transcriptional regulator [Opitutus sp.]
MAGKPKAQITSTAAFARHVGLARTTVSRVFNNQPGLRKETVERVRRAMEEVGFRPNPYAVMLLRGKTATIGMCVRYMDAPAVHTKTFALQRELRARGFTVLIEMTKEDYAETERIVRHFMLMRMEGIVFLGGFDPEHVRASTELLKPQGMPIVVGDQFEYTGLNTVILDRAKAMEELVVHLHGLGHRIFGLLGIRLNFLQNDTRVRGVQMGLERCGLSFDSSVEMVPVTPTGSRSYDYGKTLAEAFLARHTRATAFLGLNDEVAVGAMWRFQEAGLRVPTDISITGFNNMEIAQHVTPALTSVDQRVGDVMAAVADQIVLAIKKPAKRARKEVLDAQLILRGSIGPAQGAPAADEIAGSRDLAAGS